MPRPQGVTVAHIGVRKVRYDRPVGRVPWVDSWAEAPPGSGPLLAAARPTAPLASLPPEEYERRIRYLQERAARRLPLFRDGPAAPPDPSHQCSGCGAVPPGGHRVVFRQESGWVYAENTRASGARKARLLYCPACWDSMRPSLRPPVRRHYRGDIPLSELRRAFAAVAAAGRAATATELSAVLWPGAGDRRHNKGARVGAWLARLEAVGRARVVGTHPVAGGRRAAVWELGG